MTTLRRVTATAVALAALALAAGCTSDSKANQPPAAAAARTTTQDLVNKMNSRDLSCSGYAIAESLYAREAADCEIRGEATGLYTFNTSTARDNWLATAETFGGVYVVGSDWIVAVESEGVAMSVRNALGGKIH